MLEIENCSPVNIALASFVTGHRLCVKLRVLGTHQDLSGLIFLACLENVLACSSLSNNWVIIFRICFKVGLAQHNCFLVLIMVCIVVTDRQQ